MLTNMDNAATDFQAGHFELGLANLFNVTVGDFWGDAETIGDLGLMDDIELDMDLCINPLDC